MCAAVLIPPVYVDQYSDDIVDIEARMDMFNAQSDYTDSGPEVLPDIGPPGMSREELMDGGAKIAGEMFRRRKKPKPPGEG